MAKKRFAHIVKDLRGTVIGTTPTLEDLEYEPIVEEFDPSKIERPDTVVFAEDYIDDPSALAANLVSMPVGAHKGDRAIGRPRASSIHKACIRMHVLATVSKETHERIEWGSMQMRITYGIGNAYHHWVQNEPDVFGDRRVGWWKCLSCSSMHPFGRYPKTKCKHCGASAAAATYSEHSLSLNGEYPVSGHPDLFLCIADNSKIVRVNEIKSLNGAEFKKLKSPIVDHEWQIQTYMWGCSIDPTIPAHVDPNIGYITYISKKHLSGEFPVKIFKVRQTGSVLKLIKEKLAAYKKGVDNFPKNLPAPLSVCEESNFTAYQSRQCPLKDDCIKHSLR